jgi:hypothetical protein
VSGSIDTCHAGVMHVVWFCGSSNGSFVRRGGLRMTNLMRNVRASDSLFDEHELGRITQASPPGGSLGAMQELGIVDPYLPHAGDAGMFVADGSGAS